MRVRLALPLKTWLSFLKRMLGTGAKILKAVVSWLKRPIRTFFLFEWVHLFEPRVIYVQRFALYEICVMVNGHLHIRCITEREEKMPLEKAFDNLVAEWEQQKRGQVCPDAQGVFPVYALGTPSVYITQVKSLFLQNLPPGLGRQISHLALESPFSLRTLSGASKLGVITSSIVDVSPRRILILGNYVQIMDFLKRMGMLLHFPSYKEEALSSQITLSLQRYFLPPQGTKLIAGSLSALFGFEASLLFDHLSPWFSGSPERLGLLSGGILSLAIFLLMELLEDKIFAYESKWTSWLSYVNWGLLLVFLFTTPVFFLYPSFEEFIPFVVAALGGGVLGLGLISNLGKTFFEYGLTKKTIFALYLVLAGSMIFTWWLA